MTVQEPWPREQEVLGPVREVARRIWERHRPATLQVRLMEVWADLGRRAGVKLEPLCPLSDAEEGLACGVMGSGTFSTGRREILEAQAVKDALGCSPVEYAAVITDRIGSGAARVAEEAGLPLVLLDYAEWRQANGVVEGSRLFGFRRPPPPEVLDRRLQIRKRFDRDLRRRIEETLGFFPPSLSLRGYDFVVTDGLVSPGVNVDNTHPASLIEREEGGAAAYAGWQDGATSRMVSDGHTVFPATLVRVEPVSSTADLSGVDAGEILAVSRGSPSRYEKTEDLFLVALKATGLLPFLWAISREKRPVEYRTRRGSPVRVLQRVVAVGDRIRSGVDCFGRSPDDISGLLSFLNRFA